MSVIVVQRVMPGAAVVPERDRALLPLESEGPLWPGCVVVQVAKERFRLRGAPTREAHGESWVYVEDLAPRLGVTDHNAVRGILGRGVRVPDASCEIGRTVLRGRL